VVEHQPPTPTTHPELERHAHEDYRAAYEPPTVTTQYDDDVVVVSNRGDTPPSGCQPQPLPLDAQPPYQQPDHNGYNPTSDHGTYTTPFNGHKHEGGANTEPDRDLAIEQRAHEFLASDNTGVDWAEEMDIRGIQGEYYPPNNYPTPPAPPSPAPWYPPHPPTSDHLPPQTHYLPPHRWYNPQEAEYTP
jgi:hypothetical protein